MKGKIIHGTDCLFPCGASIVAPTVRLTADKVVAHLRVEKLDDKLLVDDKANCAIPSSNSETFSSKKAVGRNKNNSDEQKLQKAVKYVKKGNNRSLNDIL